MQKISYIYKSFSWIIVLVIVHMHVCSFCCSTGIFSCCSDSCGAESACHHKKADSGEKDGDCQQEHIAFFNSIGRYQVLHIDLPKVFPSLVGIILPTEIFQSGDVFHASEIYTGFQPPPPKEDTRILIRSFQI